MITSDACDALPVPTTPSNRCCAFYKQETASLIPSNPGSPVDPIVSCRCLINPGRLSGPDGFALGPDICTMDRQRGCQASRRQGLAQLCSRHTQAQTAP